MPVAGGAAARSVANKKGHTTQNLHADSEMYKKWALSQKVSPEVDRPRNQKGFFKYQERVYEFYSAANVQWFVAGLIMTNFLVNIINCEMDPFGRHPDYKHIWPILEDLFNWLFLIELLVNMYGSWAWKFWNNSWNVFDFIVVIVGMLSVARVALPGPLGLLRMLRAFRVFRLFKRIKSLNKIIVALTKAVPGVMNAFIVLLLVMCIYAILAVEFFGEFGVAEREVDGIVSAFYETGAISGSDGGGVILSDTPRLYPYGDEYWGNFGRSIYSLFQVLTGESWSEVIARPLLFGKESHALGVAFYFVSFILICSIVLINVVIAVLLEKMVDDDPEDEQNEINKRFQELSDQEQAVAENNEIVETTVPQQSENQEPHHKPHDETDKEANEIIGTQEQHHKQYDETDKEDNEIIGKTVLQQSENQEQQPLNQGAKSLNRGANALTDMAHTSAEVKAIRGDLATLREVLHDVIHLKTTISGLRCELDDTKTALRSLQTDLSQINTALQGIIGIAPGTSPENL